ncbi:MAG: hypothetical protein RLZZ301_786 [Bacteroidota bacterium]|jgi:dTDP-4-dehydrorhamnose reductase
MKLLITGSNGLLGQKLIDLCLKKQLDFIATSSGENRYSKCPAERYQTLDITDEAAVRTVIAHANASHVIHTAAMTNVDACELNPEACDLVNRQAVRSLARVCAELGIHFQLLSTDFVFDGQNGPYSETDIPNPLSVYARSKVEAERIVQAESNLSYSIVRTIIVYGEGENLSRSNIVLWAREALQNGSELRIIDDQFRAPTWAADLAWACLRICEINQTGIFHICGPETMSVYQIVERIAAFDGHSMDAVIRMKSSDLNQPAKRPPHTGFDLTKAKNTLGYQPKTLEETLKLLNGASYS